MARKELAKRSLDFHLPDKDLARFLEGEPLFDEYVAAVSWAQDYARANREVMLQRVLGELRQRLPPFQLAAMAENCHHNDVQREDHHGESLLVTRKGAVSAREGELGIIPGSMGTRSSIVRGKGNADSFHSCSRGAGRVLADRGGDGGAVRSRRGRAHAAAGVVCQRLNRSPPSGGAFFAFVGAARAAKRCRKTP